MATKQIVKERNDVPRLLGRVKDVRNRRIKVGIVGNKPELAIIAATNELGTDRAGKNHNITIPARSYLRSTADNKKIVDSAFDGASAVLDLNASPLRPLNKAGIILAEEVRKKIRSNIQPPNKPSTIRGKNSARTLIGKSARLVSEIAHEVV